MSEPEPCQICGAAVRMGRERAERSIDDAAVTMIPKRICTNPQCPSKTGEMSVADVV